MTYFLIFVGGGIGALARYGLQGAVHRMAGFGFPYGTYVVNIVGCFVIGILMEAFQDRFAVNPTLRVFLTIGLLGGFTTFSTFSYETFALLREGSYGLGLVNITATLLGCLVATWAGWMLARVL